MADVDDARIPIRLPLWSHQVVEYLLGGLLVLQSISAGADVYIVAAAGSVLIMLAATTDAACGLFRWLPPRLHQVLDLAAIVLLVLAPFVVGTSDPFAIFLCFAAAILLAWLNRHTRWARPVKRPTAEEAASGPSPSASPSASPAPAPPASDAVAARARAFGETVNKVKRHGPRALGRVVGRVQSGRAAKDEPGGEPDDG